MMQYVRINEKWFTLVTNGNIYYLSSAKEHHYGNVQHKKHITKVMFLLAIACTCIILLTGKMFNDKIGIWAFAKEQPAACNSKNQPKGTMEWHQVLANKEQVHCMLIENVLPAIDRKWPAGWHCKTVLCQQDNAPHLLPDDAKLLASQKGKQLSIRLVNQPLQLPNLNVNNLSLF